MYNGNKIILKIWRIVWNVLSAVLEKLCACLVRFKYREFTVQCIYGIPYYIQLLHMMQSLLDLVLSSKKQIPKLLHTHKNQYKDEGFRSASFNMPHYRWWRNVPESVHQSTPLVPKKIAIRKCAMLHDIQCFIPWINVSSQKILWLCFC